MVPTGFFFTEEFSRDPYEQYAALRATGPVHPVDFPPGATAFLVVGHEEARSALNDPRLSKDARNSSFPVPYEQFFGDTMLGLDPPEHTRLRGAVARSFTARRIEALRPRIQAITDELLDGLAADPSGQVELIERFAVPLPIRVICELLGVPEGDQERFRAWTAVLTVPAFGRKALEQRRTAASEFNAYLREIFALRRADPRDDLVSALVTDGELTEAELGNTIALLLIAGHETTVNLIGNGTLALLTHPEQLQRLRDDPELTPAAVEELLRYDGPIERASQRIALEDLEIAGTAVPKGAWVHVSLAAAHRDPAAQPSPEVLDLARAGQRHLAFGHGLHFCLGAPLARLEGRIAFRSLLDRFPGLALAVPAEELSWQRMGSIVRGLTALPVRL